MQEKASRDFLILAVIWTVLIGSFLSWYLYEEHNYAIRLAEAQARANLGKDLVLRRWTASYGGVYVPVTEATPPNTYLSHVPERDIVTPSGRLLTLVNPAYMMRLLHEFGREQIGTRNHLTSLNPLNPRNVPDSWEAESLRAFERGKTEVSSVETKDGESYLRLMFPLVTERDCLKCHAAQGYKEGDIRGGISASVPLAPILASHRPYSYSVIIGHIVLWALGLGGIAVWRRGAGKYIREHDLSEEALRESEEQFRNVFEHSTIGMALVLPDGRWHRFNRALCDLTGYSETELLAKTFQDITHPDDLDADLGYARQLLAGEIPSYQVEKRFFHKTGHVVWILLSVFLVRDNEGNPMHFVSQTRDITESKRSKERIQKTLKMETALRQIDKKILEGTNSRETLDIACDAAVDLGYCMCWMGLAEPDYTIRPVAVRGFDRKFLDELTFRWDESPQGNVPAGIAIRTGKTYVCPDIRTASLYEPWRVKAGKIGYRSSATIPFISPEEGTIGILTVFSERTGDFPFEEILRLESFARQCMIALQSSKRIGVINQLAMAVEQSADQIVVTDREGTILYVNPAFERTTGYSREEAVGKNLRILRSGKHDEAFYRELWDTLTRGEVWTGRFINRKKDGSLYEEDATISPLRDSSGEIVNYVAAKRDVTNLVSLEKQVRMAQKMESVGTLAGGIAHDFNNTLTGIIGFGELLRTKLSGDEPALHDLDVILRCAERATTLTRQLLTYARRQVIEPVNLDLSALVADLKKLIGKVVGEYIEIKTFLEKTVPTIHADRGQIEQVVMNLCLNARDAMPEGGRLVVETGDAYLDEEYVRQNPYMRTGRYALLTVSDTGIGMDEKTRERVFEPFFTTKGPDKGTGLGLAMVYGIVKQNNGFIHLYSEPGEGTTFKAYFPAVEGLPDAVPEKRRKETVRGGTETVLFAEDEEVVRDLAELTLKELGYHVLVARNGEEAVEVFRRNEDIALAVLDVIMPRKGGKEAYEAMHEANPNLKVLFTSGHAMNAIHESFRLIAGVPFLQKPYSPTSLASKVREVLDTPI